MAPLVVTTLSACSTITTQQYDAIAEVFYFWQVEYALDPEQRRVRYEKFSATSLVNQNGDRPDGAVTGPDDQGLWWPALPPRPTVDQMEERQEERREKIGTPQLIKRVDYEITFEDNGQMKTLPTSYAVYRQAVKARRDGIPLELTIGGNDRFVSKVEPLGASDF
ncbi:MAG: hypothetical protein HC881_18965 [Leptolyngbyaceae cyanobacterium SL_7_1]|nr:hypothetical protein [Leptolyngbyaceae cyanobacterium SL_7_1]